MAMLQSMFQEILTARLLLRSLLADDAEKLLAYRCCPEVLQYQSWQPQSLEEVRLFVESMSTAELNTPGWHQIGIVIQGDDCLIGDCGIHILETDSRIAEIAITIAPPYQSRGYATEVLRALLGLLFVGLCKHRVFASVDPRNLSSMALMERVGLRQEGHFVQSLWFKGSWVDDVVFAMLASEWHSKNGT
jgi:RimJ/RimL family protein N-acetyltransferase